MKRLVNRQPGRGWAFLLGALPFLLVAVLYLAGSATRLAENPSDKLLPSPASLGEAAHRMAFEVDQRSGQVLLWADTAASLQRLGLGVGISAAIGLAVGVLTGLVPLARAPLSPLVACCR